MWILYLITALVVPSVQGASHSASPCPSVFSYEGAEPERDRWYGDVLLSTEESLVGVRLDIKLDRPSQILVSWMGDVTSEDNQSFTVLSLNQKLHPGPPDIHSKFMVKFDARQGIPQVRTIRLNGRQICPPDPNFPTHHGNEGHSEIGHPSERSTKRPDPVFPPPVVDLSPVRPVVKTTEDYYSDTVTKRTTTKRYNYDDNYPPHKQANKNSYYNYEQENAVTQTTTTSNYNQDVRYSERPNFSYSDVDSRPHQSGDNDDNPIHTDPYRTKEKRVNSNENQNGDSTNSNVQTTITTRRPVVQVQSTNSNNNVKNNNNNSNQQTTTYKPAVTNSNNNNPKINSSSNQQSKPVKKPEFSGYSGSRAVTTRNTDFQKTTPYAFFETSTQRIINKGVPDVVYQHPSNRPNSKNSTKRPPSVTSPTYHESTGDDLESASSDVSCGRVQITPIPLITNGKNTARGQWPWHIALYITRGGNLNYICGGSLISDVHVVTAAHCVTKEPLGRPLPADVLVVYLGKYHLFQFSDDGGVQIKQVREIHVLPQFNSSTYTGDIAVLELSSPVEFTPFVRPVCLWDPDDTELSVVEGKEGTVVGWGFTEKDEISAELKMAQMPVVSQEKCIRSYPEFFSRSTTEKTFCAGFRNGTSVCNGDSGGGMVFLMDGAWYLRGVVSTAVSRKDANLCDTNHYIVFVDAAKYLQWIQQFIT